MPLPSFSTTSGSYEGSRYYYVVSRRGSLRLLLARLLVSRMSRLSGSSCRLNGILVHPIRGSSSLFRIRSRAQTKDGFKCGWFLSLSSQLCCEKEYVWLAAADGQV